MTTINGEQLLAERKRNKMSRKAFGELIGIPENRVWALENGRKPKPGEAEAAQAWLNSVLGGAPAPTPPAAEPDAPPPLLPTTEIGEPVSLLPPDDELEEDDENALIVLATDASELYIPSVTPGPEATAVPFVEPQATSPLQPLAEPVVIGRKISNSEVQTYKRCKRKWWLGWYRHLVMRHEKPAGARAIGTWVHLALAQHYVTEGETRTDPREALERVLLDVHTNVTEYVARLKADADDGGFAAEAMIQQFSKDADLARAMVEGYVEWLAETGADADLRIIAPEQMIAAPFEVGLEYPEPVHIVGKLDVRAMRETDGLRTFIDHKTVGSIPRAQSMLHMNEQMLHYMLLERAQYLDGQIGPEFSDGALYNMLRKVKRTGRAKPPFYQRIEVRHNNHEVANYAKHLRSTVTEMLVTEQYLREHPDRDHESCPPSPRDDCTWSCDFYAVCPMFDDGSRAEDMLRQYYVQTEHLAYYGDSLASLDSDDGDEL